MIRLFVPIRAGSTPGKPASPSMSNIRLICKTSIAAYLALAAAAQSETYVWDPAVDGGATAAGGVWDLTTPNWSGAPSRLWPNESGIDADFAVFEGVGVGPFTVNLGAAVVANGLVFNTNGYTISDGGIPANTLTLSGSAPLVSVTTAGDVAGITAIIAGTAGLTKTGAGTLVLGGANTYGGATSIAAGVLSFSTSSNLGGALAGNSLAISNSATLRFTGTTDQSLGTTRTLSIGDGGATIEQAGTGLLTLSGAITALAGNTLTKTGAGTLLLTANSAGWSGDVVVNAGTLQVGNAAATQFINGLGASSASRTVTINAGGTLDFQGRDATGGNPAAFVINGGTLRNTSGFTRLGNLTLNGGTIDVIQGNSGTFQALTFNADVTVTGTTPSVITTTGGTNNGIHLEKAGGVVITVPNVTGDAAPDLSIATPLRNITSTSAANGFIKNGAGTLLLTGANAFTGTMVINDGEVLVGGANAANAPISFSEVAGGTPLLTVNAALRVGNITQSAAGTPGVIIGTGSVTLNGNRTLNVGDTASAIDLLIGVPVGNGDTTARALTKAGAGTVQFNGVNTFTGTLTINEGTVVMNAGQSAAGGFAMGSTAGATPRLVIADGVTYRVGANPQTNAAANGTIIEGPGSFGLFADRAVIIFDNAAADDLIISAPIANGDATARSWRKEQTGRMVIQGDNTYTGNTDFYRGTVVLDYSLSTGSKLPDAGGISNMRGSRLILSGNASAPVTEVVTSFGIPTGTSTVQLNPNNGQALTFNLNAITRNVGQGVVNFATTDAALGTFQTTTVNNLQGILGPYATFNGNRFATVDAGTLAPVVSTVQSDRSQWGNANHIVVDAVLSGLLTTPAINSLIFDAAAANTLAIDNAGGALRVQSGGVVVTAAVGVNNTVISGGRLMVSANTNAGGGELVLTNHSTGTLTVSSSIVSNDSPHTTTQGLTLGGSGLIEITGRNFYSGVTGVQGNVRIAGGNAFSDFTNLNIAAGGDMMAAGGALLDLNGSTEGVGSLAGGAFTNQGTSEIRLGTGGTLTINQTAASTYAAQLTGSGTVIKKGSATLTLTTNPQAFTGEWHVLGGLTDFTGNNAGLTGIASLLLRGGSLLAQQDQGASVDKIANGAVVRLEGTTGNGFRVTSNQNGARSETVDKLELNAGSNIITLTNTAGSPTAAITTLVFANTTDAFSRSNGATLLARTGVADFGGPSVAQTNRVTFASGIAGDLVGGGGAAGAPNISILPFAIGGTGNVANPGETFLTIGANGLRPLDATEFVTDYATAGITDNLSQAVSGAALATKVINSLRIDNSAANVDLAGNAGSTLTVTSGALLVSAGANANTSLINGYDQVLAGAADAVADELIVHVTSSNATPAAATLTVGSVIANNGAAATSLTKSGNGTLVLGAANTYTGETTVNQGVLQFAGANGLGVGGRIRLAGGTLAWGPGNTTDISTKADSSFREVELLGASPYLTPSGGSILNVGNRFDVGSNEVILGNVIGNNGVGGLTKAGAGTLWLAEAATYKGPTLVREGAMNFATIEANTTSGLWLAADSGTVSSTINSGLNVQSLIVGAVFSGTASSTGSLTVNGGAVNIGDGSGDDFILLGVRPTGAANSVGGVTMGTADFSAAASVTIDVAQIIMAQTATNPGSVDADLILSNTTNSITTHHFVVGNSPGPGNSEQSPTVTLGTGLNDFAVDSLVIGGQKTNGAMVFAPGATAGSFFTLRGTSGPDSSANVFIGDNSALATGTTQSADITKLDLTGGTADVKANLLVIGRHAGGAGNGAGALIFGAGIVEAQTIVLATPDARGGATANDASTVGVITQNGGVMRFQELSKGNGAATYNWNKGIISNVPGANLANQNVTIDLLTAAEHEFHVNGGRTATFESAAGFRGDGVLMKTGLGTLALQGASTFTGGTLVEEGTLLANNTTGSALGTGFVNVGVGGTLSGSGAVSGDVTVQLGGTIAPGDGIGTLQTGGLFMESGATFALQINTSGLPNSDLLGVNGSLTLDVANPTLSLTDLGGNAPLLEGTVIPFVSYSGGWNGGLFSVNGNPISDDIESFQFGANVFTIDYDFGGTAAALVVVPEPATGTILLGGLASLLGMRRVRRRRE
jgi:fibronectin-binding autotransporter adhesin